MIDPQRLTIFYYIVRHGGMATAARKMPELGSLAVFSRQMARLEQEIGARLFRRSPFQLSPVGHRLYGRLPAVADLLVESEQSARAAARPSFRVALEAELRENLLIPAAPAWLQAHPNTPVLVQSGSVDLLHSAFLAGEYDLLLTLERTRAGPRPPGRRFSHPRSLPGPRPPARGAAAQRAGLGYRILGTRPLVLLVPKSSRIRYADHFWRQKQVSERLMAPPAGHPVVGALSEGLRQGGIAWPPQIETQSVAHVLPFVAAGLGCGVTLDLPASTQHPLVRALPLPGFNPIAIACHWHTPATPQVRTALRLAAQCIAGSLEP